MFRMPETTQFYATMETLSETYKEFYESECPIGAFPKVIRDVAKTYSTARNLPMELLCFCACGILSGAMGRVFKARNAVSGGEIFSVCEEARDSIYIVAGNYRKQGDDTETLNSGWCGEPIKHSRIVNGVFNVPNPCISLLWMVQNDIIDNIVAKNKGSFIGSGFLGRFLYCKGAPKTDPNSKEIIPLDESAISKWEKLLNDTYDIRKRGETVWVDADQEAFEYFWDFDAFNTRLMNGKLRTQASLLGKARENAIRLAVIFAQAEGATQITADIAKRACRVVSYSICVSVVLFSSGMLPDIENDRAKMDAMIRQNDGFYKKISFSDQYSSLRSERVEFIVHTFPSIYEIVKKGKGRYVVLKDRLNDAKQVLGIETDDDDDLF